MTALLSAIPLPYRILGVAVIAGALLTVGYLRGRADGKVDQLADSVTAYQNREKVDADVQNVSRYQLCRRLGGLPEQCDELRGLEEAPASK